MRSIRKLSTGAGMAVALCIGISQPVAAQTQDDGALAEVTVTAQRRS